MVPVLTVMVTVMVMVIVAMWTAEQGQGRGRGRAGAGAGQGSVVSAGVWLVFHAPGTLCCLHCPASSTAMRLPTQESYHNMLRLAAQAGPKEMNTEAVEEFISISDGQLVLEEMQQQEEGSSSGSRYRANPKLSVTRIGTRAYYKAMEVLAPQVRVQAGPVHAPTCCRHLQRQQEAACCHGDWHCMR
jgi:hypothetical protein